MKTRIEACYKRRKKNETLSQKANREKLRPDVRGISGTDMRQGGDILFQLLSLLIEGSSGPYKKYLPDSGPFIRPKANWVR